MKEMNNLNSQTNIITPKIMGKINWRKVRQPKFEKDRESDKHHSLLIIPFRKKTCYIYFKVSEKGKQELKKMDCWEITENFITEQLKNRERSGYFDDNCPECEQPTLTKLPIVNSYREAIVCSLCDWGGSLEQYLDYKKENSSLSYSEWLTKSRYRK